MLTTRRILLVLCKEIFFSLLLLLGVSLVIFNILYFSPGDPFGHLLSDQLADASARENVVNALGLPSSISGQFVSWLVNVLQGNLGTSLRTGKPVLDEIFLLGSNTLFLTIGSLLIALLISLPIAVFSALKTSSFFVWPFTIIAYLLSAIPLFWLGYIVIYICTEYFGVFPIQLGLAANKPNVIIITLLPVLVLGIASGAISEMVRYIREELTRVLNEDYIRTAKAKGASVWRHAFIEGLLMPITIVLTNKVPFILGGAIIVEQIFNRPGLGRMAWQAAQDRDFPVIMGITLAAAILVRLAFLLQRMIFMLAIPSHQVNRKS